MKLKVLIIRTESGEFLASCPSLPGCRTCAQTREEAKQKISDAICGYMAAINDFVPEHVVHEVVEA